MAEEAGTSLAVCACCGVTADGPTPPLDWMDDHDARRGRVSTCPACARTHLRAIEGKLDQDWW